MINNDTYGNLKPADLKKILKEYREAARRGGCSNEDPGRAGDVRHRGRRGGHLPRAREQARPATAGRRLELEKTGCIGMCYREPLVEVRTTTAGASSTAA